MFEPAETPRVFALPPGVDFTKSFLAGLAARLSAERPDAAGRIEIFVNTRRMQRRLKDRLLEGPAAIQPRIRVITDLAGDPLPGLNLPPARPELDRQLDLAQLVQALLRAAPDLAPESAMFDMADSLARLLDELHEEAVTPDIFAKLDVSGHALHWSQSLAFLRILQDYVTSGDAPDPAERQRRVVDHLTGLWQSAPPEHPIIVAGSTASRGTTRAFMEAVARLPQGAVVLPGYDSGMPADIARHILDGPSDDHPQARLVHFTAGLGLDPTEVPAWHHVAPASPTRNRLVSLALRPAPVTDQWRRDGPKLGDLGDATENLSLIEAPTQRDEATAIALCLRQAVQSGQRAALITPDRVLTRLVTTQLQTWRLWPDDSAGRPLPLTPPGVFLRLLTERIGTRLTCETLLILLKHPLAHSTGKERGLHLLRTRDLELDLIRGGAPFAADLALANWAAQRKNDEGAAAWARWVLSLIDRATPPAEAPLATYLAWHRGLAEALANGSEPAGHPSELWQQEAGEKAEAVLCSLEKVTAQSTSLTAPLYANLFRSVLQGEDVREAVNSHPGITIWGTLEARVEGADIVILGGLNEGVWPGSPTPDPWLSRDMRRQAGLSLPERQIGLSAHDFQQAIAGKTAILTRALRNADAPTVASRWLIRLTNLMAGLGENGQIALDAMRSRGDALLAIAARLDQPGKVIPPAQRPSPCPPTNTRPRRLSVTQIKTLIRDPYAIYARSILGIRKLDPLRQKPSAALRGEVLHNVLETFIRETETALPADAADRLTAIAADEFQLTVPWPATNRLWQARLARVAEAFVASEHRRREIARPFAYERRGQITLDSPRFTLVGEADRIDRTADGRLIIYDYKTGSVPSKLQVELFDKQLLLEAAMAEAGAFEGIDPAPVSSVAYIGISAPDKDRTIAIDDDRIARTWDGLRRLIAAYQSDQLGYTARARMERRTDPSDYDHLSRRGEWDDSDAPNPEGVA